MKNFFIVFPIIFIAVFFAGCGADLKTQIKNNISDIRHNIFVGESEDLSVNLMSGYRENPYKYDGISHKKCQFGIITLTLKNAENYANLPFEIQIDDDTIKGSLEENPYDHTFMVDIEKVVNNDSEIYITIENLTDRMVLTCESKNWAVQYDDALKIGVGELIEKADIFVEDGKFKAECYLKIIFDQKATENPYYWYLGIVGENGENIAVIFSPISSEIITKSI